MYVGSTPNSKLWTSFATMNEEQHNLVSEVGGERKYAVVLVELLDLLSWFDMGRLQSESK